MRTPDQRLLDAVQRPEAYREVVLDSDGVPVVLSVWDGEPDRAAVVFLPGTMTHPLFYEELLDALNRAGHPVVGLHPAGHGKSPRVRRRLTVDLLLRNAVDAVAWTRRSFPRSPVVLLGSSQGGALALAAGARCGDAVAGVVAHNVLDPRLPESAAITRAPRWAAPAYGVLPSVIRGLARVAPGLPVPFDAYLEMERVTRDPATANWFRTDPLTRRSYPLRLLAGLLDLDVTAPLSCRVVVLAASHDPLFALAYIRRVFERIDSPAKELVVLDADVHLLLNEALDLVLPVLLERLRVPAPSPAVQAG